MQLQLAIKVIHLAMAMAIYACIWLVMTTHIICMMHTYVAITVTNSVCSARARLYINFNIDRTYTVIMIYDSADIGSSTNSYHCNC